MKNTLIKDTTLSIRCINCLHAADIRTTDDLKAHIEKFGISDFVKFRHFGFKTFDELKKFVEENKLIENEVSEDSKKLAIEFAEWKDMFSITIMVGGIPKVFRVLEDTKPYYSNYQLFDKFIEQRNK